MKDILHLLWAFVGAILGLAVGLLADIFAFNRLPDSLQSDATVAGILLFGLPALGMVAGGWIALYASAKIDKARRGKARQQQKKFVPKKRKK